MVFMKRRDEGHPLGALFVLSSMFAFAFVFHIVTKSDPQLPARFDLQLAALTEPVAPIVPVVPEVPVAPEATETPGSSGTSGTPEITSGTAGTPGTAEAALPSRIWSTPAALPAPISAVEPNQHPRDTGAVTRALATTSAALRSAFRKTF
jgi:hypothetical protein